MVITQAGRPGVDPRDYWDENPAIRENSVYRIDPGRV
jgi:hypothetical protein